MDVDLAATEGAEVGEGPRRSHRERCRGTYDEALGSPDRAIGADRPVREFIERLGNLLIRCARQADDGRTRPIVGKLEVDRLERPAQVYELGIEEALAEGVSLIEWPELAMGLLPKDSLLTIELAIADGDARHATVEGGANWRDRVTELA